MAEAKPKGEPVFLKIPATGETITLPGVTSLNNNDELKAAADAWIAKNYKGPVLAAPIVERSPAVPFDQTQAVAPTEEISVTANRQPELKAYTPTTITGGVYDALQSGFATLADLIPGFDERRANDYASNILRNIKTGTEGILGIEATERNIGDIATGRATLEDYLNVGLLALPFAAKPVAAGFRRAAPELSAAAGRFATGPGAVADEIAAAVPETALTPEMAAVAAPVVPAPVVPSKLPKAKPVELPEAPVAAAAIPEAAVAPTPEAVAPAITPERLADIRTNAETVLNDIAAGVPEAPIPERIGALKTTNLETPDQTKRFLSDVAKANKDFPDARRGTMTIGEINELSKDVNLNDILGRKTGMPLNAEQIQAAKAVVYETTDDAITKAKAWVASGGQDVVAFQDALDSLTSNTALFETLQGASSELGRAMRVLRERPSVDVSLAMKQLMEQRAGGVPIEDIMQRLATFDDPNKAAEFIGKIATPGFKDKIEEFYVNSLLSGPHTQTLNIVSNFATALGVPIEKGLAAGIGALRRTPDRIAGREVLARVNGMVQGTRDGLRLAKDVLITGDTPGAVTALERQRKAISGVKGEVVRIPSRFLASQDEFFKAIHRRGELSAQAYARAAKESAGNKDKFKELYAKYLDNPTPSALKAAEREALYRTFQSELGQFGKWVQAGATKFFPIRFLQPFIRTPFNLLKYSAERSPLPFISDRWRAEIKAGGRQRDDALAKLTLGMGIAGTTTLFALQGNITGSGPSDPAERAALMATGWQPYSFKIDDKYYPYGRIDPIGTSIGVIADLVTMKDYMTEEEYTKIATLIPFSVAANLAEKTYLQGFTNLFEAFFAKNAPVEKIQDYLENTAAGFYPNILRQTANAIDPQLRDAEGFLKEIQNRTPVLRGNTLRVSGTDYDLNRVPARIDIWGEPIYRSGFTRPEQEPAALQPYAVLRNAAFPVRSSTLVKDPVKLEVSRLRLGLDRPDKKVSVSVDIGKEEPVKFNVELTDQERRQFTFASGKLAKVLVQADLKTPEWKKMNDDERREQIRDRMSFSRQAFRETFGVKALNRYVNENKKLPPVQP